MPAFRFRATARRRRGSRAPFAVSARRTSAGCVAQTLQRVEDAPGEARDAPDLTMIRALFDDPGRARIVGLLIATTRTELARFARADAAGDRTIAAEALHRLLGSLCLLGPMPVLEDGRGLLQALRASGGGPDPATSARLQQRLHVLVDRLERTAG